MTADFIAAKMHVHLALGGWRVWHEVTLGPTREKNYGRVDIWALRVSWSPVQARIYEIKTSRSDFKKDLDDGKWTKYIPHATEIYFATPSDLITPMEVPDPAGLVYITKNLTPKIIKRATFNRDWKPDGNAMLALLMSISTPPDPYRVYARVQGPRVEDYRFRQEIDRENARIRLEQKHKDRSAGHSAASAVAKSREEAERWKNQCEEQKFAISTVDEISKLLGVYSYCHGIDWQRQVLSAVRHLKAGKLSECARAAIRTLASELNEAESLARQLEVSSEPQPGFPLQARGPVRLQPGRVPERVPVPPPLPPEPHPESPPPGQQALLPEPQPLPPPEPHQ